MKNDSSNLSLQSLNRSQMKTLKGGALPDGDLFCCDSAYRESWLAQYNNSESELLYLLCDPVDCSN